MQILSKTGVLLKDLPNRANLSGASLSGANLSGADLRSANLRSADLRSADLSGADLRSALYNGQKLKEHNPLLQIGPIGSRKDYLIVFNTETEVFCRVGCFNGTLAEFGIANQKQHGNNVFGATYATVIAMVKVLVDLK